MEQSQTTTGPDAGATEHEHPEPCYYGRHAAEDCPAANAAPLDDVEVPRMAGAWDDAYGRASEIVGRLAQARRARVTKAELVAEAEQALAAEDARLAPDAAMSGSNDMIRKAALVALRQTDEAYHDAQITVDRRKDDLAVLDAGIAADHDRLSLLKRELDWLIAQAGQRHEERVP